MQLFRLSFLLLLVTAFSTCGDDDEMTPPCAPSKWLGTYTGMSNCNGLEEEVTVTITTGGMDAIVISYETLSRTGTSGLVSPDECMVNASSTSGPVTTTLEAELEGNTITLREEVTGVGGNFTCDIMATR